MPPSPILLNGSVESNMSPPPLQFNLESVFDKHHAPLRSTSSSPAATTPSTPKDNLPPGGYLEMHSSGAIFYLN